MHPKTLDLARRGAAWAGLLGLALAGSGCTLLSPAPLFELVKAGGAAASVAVSQGGSHASDTVYHLHSRFDALCIEYNADTPSPDLVPALQAELRLMQIESRLYEGPLPSDCKVRLQYTGAIAWDIPPMGSAYQPYVTRLSLSLRDASGNVLSSSHYALDGGGMLSGKWGKWASTRSKVSPVVKALVTGFEG